MVPMVAFKLNKQKLVHLLILPYLVLVEIFKKKLSPWLNVINAKELGGFSPDDYWYYSILMKREKDGKNFC